MEIRQKLDLPNVYYNSFQVKEDDLQRKLSLFVKITNLSIVRFLHAKNYLKSET